MAEEQPSTPPGDGPYRTAPARRRSRHPWIPWLVGAILALVALAVAFVIPWGSESERPSLSSIPPGLFDEVSGWPLPESDLPPATPLAPLLVADAPDALAVLAPGEGATRLARGESLWVRFNRPMVEGPAVGTPLEEPPLVFDPPLAGEARWTSRSTLSFTPSHWAYGVREVRLSFAPSLASVSGEALVDDRERVLVLDGSPRVLSYLSQGRVVAGAPLPLVFDAPVSLNDLRGELLAYEIGGGRRSLPFSLALAASDQGHRVDVRLGRSLEPGARIGLALAPRYLGWHSGSPAVMSYELAPRPHIEGIACSEGAAYVGQCTYQASPGAIIDIGPSLRLLASARLRSFTPSNVRVTPAVRDLRVRLAPHGPPERRLIEIEGEWEPDQVYEVRVSGLVTESGEPVRALPPLAVRSAGHPPQIRVASGRLTFEHDATPELPFAAIHSAPSDILYRAVAPGQELQALVSAATFVREGGASEPLEPLAPGARPNRWGEGTYRWQNEARGSRMAVVAFRADPSRNARDMATAFVQSTDLGVTVRATHEGLLVWVTRLSSAEPVRGAHVSVADAQARSLAGGTTDADGIARISLQGSPLVASHAIRVVHGEERAALLLDPRSAVGPASMGLTPGPAVVDGAPVATVFTDRGAYRPGESMHAKVVLRRVEGARAEAVTSGEHLVRLFAPGASAAVAERTVTPSRFGTASVDFTVPLAASLGRWRVEVARSDQQEVLGSAEVQVAEFRQPTFRVDLGAIEGPVHAGERIGTDASSTYLFGAPVTRGELSWSLVRAGAASYPERWARYTFAPVGESAGYGTVASGRQALEASGALRIEADVALAARTRTELALEAEVTDAAGHTHAARRTFVAYPASVEVGLKEGPDWVALGSELALEAIAIDHDGEPVVEQAIEARVVREGWHSWWEWSSASDGPRNGRYQMRRDQRREVVHRCALESAGEPVRCAFTPTRPGTYVLEAEVQDEAGRTSMASRRLYVAGPDEAPDRDPPGAPVTVTPVRARWTVGETAELAFESPFETAEALITVEREGVLQVERKRVTAGGNVIRIPMREAMVPSVVVGVTLVKPRTGAPGETIDLHAPDLRFGVAELSVQPASASLQVSLELEGRARPGTEVPVAVRVTDARGRPVRGEVALWAVDEGTLRLTSYQVPDPTRGLYRARPAAFAWEDLRRSLVSRIETPPVPRPSGDGGEGQATSRRLDDRERFDPTPLWMPALTTDERGFARATITLPARPTEYRVMAVALDASASSGRASAQLVAEQPLVLRSALPRFLTAGDRAQASAFVHNATDVPIEAEVSVTVGGERRSPRAITIPARGEVRIAEALTAPAEGPLAIRFDASAGGESTSMREEIPIQPRGRFVRSRVFATGRGSRELDVGLPEGTPRTGARASVTVASHPFVGLDAAIEGLSSSPWMGTEPLAATVLALCGYAALDVAESGGLSMDEVSARGREAVSRLLALQSPDGGFGRWSRYGGALPGETAVAVHALGCAAERGWLAEASALARGVETLTGLANGSAFGDWYGEPGLDRNAYALRVLSELGAPQEARAGAVYEQRERLSPYGLAQLALALGESDPRTDTLVTSALDQALAERADEASDPSVLRFTDRSPRVMGALLAAASRFEAGRARAGEIAGHLLGAGTASPIDTGHVLHALAEYAALWHWDEGDAPRAFLDGSALPVANRSRAGATFTLPVERLLGAHRLRVQGGDEGPVFFAIDGRYAVPLGEPDTIARGRRAALHRVYETPDGRRLESGASVPLGSLVRVRLFVHTEVTSPEIVSLRDPIPAGFEAVDAGHDTSPRAALAALMGTGPDDGAVDARAHHASRSLSSIAHRSFRIEAASFYFDRLPLGLAEYTYAIRATTVGEFTAPPSQLEALFDPDFVARGAVDRLVVVERE